MTTVEIIENNSAEIALDIAFEALGEDRALELAKEFRHVDRLDKMIELLSAIPDGDGLTPEEAMSYAIASQWDDILDGWDINDSQSVACIVSVLAPLLDYVGDDGLDYSMVAWIPRLVPSLRVPLSLFMSRNNDTDNPRVYWSNVSRGADLGKILLSCFSGNDNNIITLDDVDRSMVGSDVAWEKLQLYIEMNLTLNEGLATTLFNNKRAMTKLIEIGDDVEFYNNGSLAWASRMSGVLVAYGVDIDEVPAMLAFAAERCNPEHLSDFIRLFAHHAGLGVPVDCSTRFIAGWEMLNHWADLIKEVE